MNDMHLVTGGAGFVGSALVHMLLRRGHGVRVLDDFSRGRRGRLDVTHDRLHLVDGDVRCGDTVLTAAERCTAIWHFAAVNGTRFFYERPAEVLTVAVDGMMNVARACAMPSVRHLFLASSSEVYQTPSQVPTPETEILKIPDPLNPRYSYAGGKLISELVALHCAADALERVVIIRPHNIYGPDMGHEHVIPDLCRKVMALKTAETREGSLSIKGDGGQKRAFMHIDDFCRAVVLLHETPGAHGIYHVGSNEVVTIADLAHMIMDILGYRVPLQAEDAPAGETRIRLADISKIGALGFRPRISLRDGLPDVVEWYRAFHG